MVSPARRREAAEKAQTMPEVSERRACKAIGQPRSTQRYVAKERWSLVGLESRETDKPLRGGSILFARGDEIEGRVRGVSLGLGIVERGAPDRHDGIADELVDIAALAADRGTRGGEIAV